MLSIPKSVCRNVPKACGKEAARFVLNHVRLEDRGGCDWRIEACDGRRAIRVDGSSAKDWPAETVGLSSADNGEAVGLVHPDALKGHVKGNKSDDPHVHVVLGKRDAGISSEARGVRSVSTARLADAKFPPMDAVIPARDAVPEFTIGFNPSMLGDLLKAVGAMVTPESQAVRLDFYGPRSACKITGAGEGCDITAVIMPLLLE